MNIKAFGSIINTEDERSAAEDITPAMLADAVNRLGEGEGIELDITSFGGSATAALAMSNILKQASLNGHKTTAHVIGIAASSASVIAFACDELVVDTNAFLMLHLPWSSNVGNSIDLRKEADVLDQYRDMFVSIYKSKIPDKTADDIIKMLEDETWIVGSDAKVFGISCTTTDADEPLAVAASAKRFASAFKCMPKLLLDEPEKLIPLAEAEKRVSGMQSAMGKQVNALKTELEAKTKEFEIQMRARD